MVPWKRHYISLDMDLDHFGLSGPFIGCLYFWYFSVSGNMTTFIFPSWMVTSPVALFMSAQSSSVWHTVVVVDGWVGIFLGGAVVFTWLAMRLWPLRCLALLLYFCYCCSIMVLTSYVCISGGIISMLSLIRPGAVWGG